MDNFIAILSMIALMIAGLSILVVIHELGHFLPAKWFGVRVEKFYLFFDWPIKLFSFKKNGTEYGIGVLPLGGYVKVSGILDESMDRDYISKPPESWEFRAKPVWQRMIIMAGGVIMNVLLGVLIFSLLARFYGVEKTPITELRYGLYVPQGSAAAELGFHNGDKILSLNGKPVEYLNDILSPNVLLDNDVTFEVLRENKNVFIQVPDDYVAKFQKKAGQDPFLFRPRFPSIVVPHTGTPAAAAGLQRGDKIVEIDGMPIAYFDEIKPCVKPEKIHSLKVERNGQTLNLSISTNKKAIFGIEPEDKIFKTVKKQYGMLESVGQGSKTAFSAVTNNIKGMKKIADGNAEMSESLSGPVKIARILYDAVMSNGMLGFWTMMGMLSMVLAFMNILPIPALDGGHLVFLAIEAITGREPSIKVRMVAQQIGMAMLLILMLFIFYNDIFN